MGREYFYHDKQGKLQKYIYCTSCSAGPFKQNDPEIHHCGDHVHYCRPCQRLHGVGKDDELEEE